jgi:hypothetical protein
LGNVFVELCGHAHDRLFFSGDVWFSLVSSISRFEFTSEGVLFCLPSTRIILKVLSSVASCEVFFLSFVCWTKFTAAVFDLGVASRSYSDSLQKKVLFRCCYCLESSHLL